MAGRGLLRQGRQLGGRGADRVDQQPARGRQPGQGVLVAWVLGHGLLGRGLGVDKPLVGDVQVGQQDLGRSVMRVDRQGALGLGPARGQAVALQVGLAQRHQDLGRQRVDLLGPGQLLGGGTLVVAREEKLALEPGGLPAVGIGPEGGLVDLVDHVVERVAQLFAPGRGAVVPLGGLADEQQVLGIPCQIGRPGIVVVHEPLAAFHRVLELPSRLEQADSDPPSQQVVRTGVQGLLDRGVGGLPVSAGEVQLGQPGSDVGILGLPAGKRFQNFDRLAILSLASLAFGRSHRQGSLELRRQAALLFFRFALGRLIGFLSLGIAAVLQEPPRRVRALGVHRCLLGRPRRLGQECQHRHRDRVCHLGFLRGLFFHVTKARRRMAPLHGNRVGVLCQSREALRRSLPHLAKQVGCLGLRLVIGPHDQLGLDAQQDAHAPGEKEHDGQ